MPYALCPIAPHVTEKSYIFQLIPVELGWFCRKNAPLQFDSIQRKNSVSKGMVFPDRTEVSVSKMVLFNRREVKSEATGCFFLPSSSWEAA